MIGLLYVTGLVADRPLPFGGTLATASVLAIALVAGPSGEPRWTRLARVAGLAAVTACAAIVDAQYGGNGWPVHATHWGTGYRGVTPALLAEAGLLALGGGLLAASVLGRAERVLRIGNLPAAVAAVLLLLAPVLLLRPGSGPAGAGTVIALALVALALLALAVNAALLSGRPALMAAVGLIPLVVALCVVTRTLIDQRSESAREREWQASAPVPQINQAELKRVMEQVLQNRLAHPETYSRPCAGSYRPADLCDLTVARRSIPVVTEERHWWRGAAGGLLLVGLLGVALRGSREA